MQGLKSVVLVAALVFQQHTADLRAANPLATKSAPAATQTASKAGGDREKLVGTYRLVTIEVKNGGGKWIQTPGFSSLGYITYSDSGYMGVHIMPKNRPQYAGTEPTPEEALQLIQGYSAYFGPYVVNEREKVVIQKRVGQINPGGDPGVKRYCDFIGNRVILTPAPPSGGKDQATRHIVWERLPDVPLSAEAKKFLGVRKLWYRDRYVEKAGTLTMHGERNEILAGSYIFYMPTGHMMVHLIDRTVRQTKYAGTPPTPQ